MVNSSIALLAVAMASGGASAFTAPRLNLPSTVQSYPSTTSIHATSSRRDLFTRAGSAVATTVLTTAFAGISPAVAASTPPTPEELARIQTGYENIVYLLANWDQETTTCRENGGECKRDADKVRKYLGLRSTTDPLFQIEKVFAKVRFMEDIDPDTLDAFFDATEDW